MRPLVTVIATIALSLGAVEGLAYWWMNPPVGAGQDQPVLAWHPLVGQDRWASPRVANGADRKGQETGDGNQLSVIREDGKAADPSAAPSSISAFQRFSVPAFTYTPLPEIYAKSAQMLRSSGGQVYLAKTDDGMNLHLAFIEWDDADTGSVLEAFRHMPEVCMGSIGLKLVSKEPPMTYQVNGTTLTFDHTVFLDPGQQGGGLGIPGARVHAFRAVWVAGMAGADARQGVLNNSLDQLRGIRLQAALTRFRPNHARVIQGAVRGAANADQAWEAFEQAMLKDLSWVNAETLKH